MGRIILVRHGETQLNAEGVFFGIKDPTLNEKGKIQAEESKKTIEKLEYDKIYSSDLLRALETAEIINIKNMEIEKSQKLRELNFGIFEGYKYNELKELYPEQLKKSEIDWKNYNYETGESVRELQERAVSFIEELDLEKNNLIVTHWGVINTILSHYFSTELEGYWKFSVKNGGIVIIDFLDNFPILRGLNIGG